MATKTSRRALTADAATATDETAEIASEATLAPATIAHADEATDIANAPVSVVAPRITKAAQIRAMLEAPGGASLTSLMAATSWQAHTVRAALSVLRKGGTELARDKRNGDTVYRIVSAGAENGPAEPEIAGSQPTVLDRATSETGGPA